MLPISIYKEYPIIGRPIIGNSANYYWRPRKKRASVFKLNIMCKLKHSLIWLSARPIIGEYSQTPYLDSFYFWIMNSNHGDSRMGLAQPNNA